MEIFKLAAIILTAVIVVGALPTFSKEISLIITLSCCTVILLYMLKMIVPVVEYVEKPIVRKVIQKRYLRNPLEFAAIGIVAFVLGVLVGLSL